MADTPSWLQEETSAPAPASYDQPGVIAQQAPPAPPVSASQTSNAASGEGDEDPELPSIILIMRLANMGVAAAMIAASVSFGGRREFRAATRRRLWHFPFYMVYSHNLSLSISLSPLSSFFRLSS